MTTPQVNPDWATLPLFNRQNWTRVRFGDVVRMLKAQVDPESGEVDRYVAGEHMETENVHIRKWGTVGDGYLGPAFIRRFEAGQVLYGSRRTYLKKVALADFSGVTSNTTFVLEANPDKLLQRLLPWLMLSERFTKHSVLESKGSTNPYINFPDIAKFEFDLPPMDQQWRIADLLWAMDDVTEARLATLSASKSAANAFSESAYQQISVSDSPDGTLRQRLGEVFTVRTGSTPSRANENYWGGDIPWVKTGEVNYQDIYDTEEKITQVGLDESAVRMIPAGSILMALYGQGPTLGRVAHLRIPSTMNQACAAFLPKQGFDTRYLYHYMVGQYSNIRKLARGASQPNINTLIVKGFTIPVPTHEEQTEIANTLDSYEQTQQVINDSISANRKLLAETVNALF